MTTLRWMLLPLVVGVAMVTAACQVGEPEVEEPIGDEQVIEEEPMENEAVDPMEETAPVEGEDAEEVD